MLKTEKIEPKHSSIRTEMTYNVSSGTLTRLARYDTIPVTTPHITVHNCGTQYSAEQF